jgi:NAD(P)-dependent dehydrogenase (short-subunit alcohol dehydrogenase family)
MDISGAVALVTGGSGGLGSRICSFLANEGVLVAIGYHRGEERAEEVRKSIEATGGSAMTVQVDQMDPASISNAVSNVVEDSGSLDIVVNNAGIAMGGHSIELGDLDAFTPEIWDEMMAVNLRAISGCARSRKTSSRLEVGAYCEYRFAAIASAQGRHVLILGTRHSLGVRLEHVAHHHAGLVRRGLRDR